MWDDHALIMPADGRAQGARLMESFEGPDGTPPPIPVMGAPAVRTWERDRLAAVRRYQILDGPPDGALDRIAALAARIFGTPMAGVTIVDDDRVWFIAGFGLPGIEQVPRAAGLCEQAIAGDGPYVVTDTAEDPRAGDHPLVQGEPGVRFYAAAPLTTPGGHRLGTVNVMDRRPREVAHEDLAVLGDLAALVMEHLELRLSSRRTIALERAVHETAEREKLKLATLADALQRSLLPPNLPELPHCEIAAHYQPAIEPIGGDFYDLFPIDEHGRRWGLFVGDVVGKGAQAAGRTSLVRYTLRTEAITRPNPARMLAGLDAAIALDQAAYGSGGAEMWFCTAAAAIVRPSPGSVIITIAAGGHPPLMVLRADGRVETRELRGPIIGCLDGVVFDNVHLELAAGDTLLLYTDGLVDARCDGVRFGDERLREFLAGCAGLTATALMERLRALAATFDEPADDDIALVALGVPA
jgi:phosphoserine phosphatase RsbU/P